MVQYKHINWQHGHQYYDVLESSTEDMALGLAEAVLSCQPENHNGHGQEHTDDEAKEAFRDAIEQMEGRYDELEYQELRRKIRVHERWGGKQAPAMVVMPDADNPKEGTVLLTDPEGKPTLYKARPEAMRDLFPDVDKKKLEVDEFGTLKYKRKPKRLK